MGTFLSAQDYVQYTVKNGLPSNHIYDIDQDSDGFMWFATKHGIVKFDGSRFKLFSLKDGLPNNDTWMIRSDLDGRLWYFSKSKFQGYIKKDSIYKFTLADSVVISPRIHQSEEKIWMQNEKGIQTLEKNTFVSLKDFGPELFKPKKEWFKSIVNFEQIKLNQSIVLADPESKQVSYLINGKIYVFDNKKEHLFTIPVAIPDDSRLSTLFTPGMGYNNTGIVGLNKGIILIDYNRRKAKYYSFKDLLGSNEVEKIKYKSFADGIQVSVPGHLILFDYAFQVIEKYKIDEKISNHNSFRDKEGNIWTASPGQGVTLIKKSQLLNNYHLLEKKVQKISLVNEDLFAGVYDDHFYRYNPKSDLFVKKGHLKIERGVYQIKTLNEIDRIFFISSNGVYSYRDNLFFQHKVLGGREVKIDKYPIAKDLTNYKKQLWGINASGLQFYDLDTQETATVDFQSGFLVCESYDGAIYVGSSDGLYKYIPGVDKKSITHKEIQLASIPVIHLKPIKSRLFVGSDGKGLYVLEKERLIHIKSTEGLSVQKVQLFKGYCWIATQEGIKKIELNEEELSESIIIDEFYEADGLLLNNVNDFIINDSIIISGSDTGVSFLKYKDSMYSQKPFIYFQADQDTLHYRGEQREKINISYSVLNFINQEHFNYEYRFLPVNKAWTRTENTSLDFFNLSPGLYEFGLKVSDQHRNQSIKSLHIRIVPHWWETTLFKVAIALLLIVAAIMLFKLLQRVNRKLEAKKFRQEKRFTEIQLQALRSQMNPHFVHNSLNAIQYFIQRNEVELSEEYLGKFAKLIRLFFEYSRKKVISISEEITLINSYLEIEKLRFEDKISYEIEVDEEIDIDEQLLPTMILQPIIENSINHGLFHKPGPGKVLVHFKYIDNSSFTILIEDDGVGLKKAGEIHKSSSKNYESKSSAVLMDRLELLNKSKEWNITYKIQDLSELNKQGTLVTILFKHTSDHDKD